MFTISVSSIPRMVALGEQIQSFSESSQLGVDTLGSDVKNTTVANS